MVDEISRESSILLLLNIQVNQANEQIPRPPETHRLHHRGSSDKENVAICKLYPKPVFNLICSVVLEYIQ